MLVTIKPQAVFKDFFDEKEYKVEINSYYDIEFYLASMHPRFNAYMSKIKQGISNESFTTTTCYYRCNINYAIFFYFFGTGTGGTGGGIGSLFSGLEGMGS